MAATQIEIAREAGVSQTIVSDVLHGRGRGRVRPETRQRILQVAHELGYRPNAMAQALRCRQSKQIVYLTTLDETNEFPALRESDLSGVARGLREQNYRLLIEVASTRQEETDVLSEMIDSGVADGGIVRVYSGRDSLWSALRRTDEPVVVIGQCSDTQITSVAHDVPTIIESAVHRLVDHGHQRIGLLVDPLHDIYHELVIDAWTSVAGRMGFDANRWFAESNNRARGKKIVGSWLAEPEHPTAIISLDAGSVLGATVAIKERGGELGRNYDLVAVCQKDTAWLYETGTLHYALDMESVGERAAAELLAMLGGSQGAGPIRLIPGLTEI